ncbi:MAG: hypothetical protein ACOWWO_13230 [Peptococcaceae bacterium]
MLIESLIRLGLPYLQGDGSDREIIEYITDVKNVQARNFWQNIWIAEYQKSTGRLEIYLQSWGSPEQKEEKGKGVFLPDYEKAVGAPLTFPSGGNPIEAQGAYGIPVYPLYDKHFQAFSQGEPEVISFLRGRLQRTETAELDEEIMERLGKKISEAFRECYSAEDNKKKLGILILAVIGGESPYYYEDKGFSEEKYTVIGESRIEKDRFLALDLAKALKHIWQAKEREGEEKGFKHQGKCHFTGQEGKVLSIYNKAWPWYTTTWEAPFSIYQDEKKLVDSIALSPEIYRALTLGASLIKKITKPIPNWLVKEIFSPANSGKGKEFSRATNEIYGFVIALPILDKFLDDGEEKADFINGMNAILHDDGKSGTSFHLNSIVGIQFILPPSLQSDLYRLNLVYYSGDSNRGDIHLRASIEDVIPSTVEKVQEILNDLPVEETADFLGLNIEKTGSGYKSLPFLLVKAYGGVYLWTGLAKVLHKKRIDERLFIKNVVGRMNEFAKDLGENFYTLKVEVLFYLVFTQFIRKYNQYINHSEGGMEVVDWKELRKKVESKGYEDFEIKNIVEAGFYAGYIVRQFAKQYYQSTNRKEFIKDRVLTYGSSLTPEIIAKNALAKFEEYNFKLDLKLKGDLRPKAGIVSLYYVEHKEEVLKNKDDYLAAFWAGYSLNNTVETDKEGGKDK